MNVLGHGLPRFETMEIFYEDRGGRGSAESDFGRWWYDGQQAWSGCWRVSAVEETGDVYAVKERLGGREEHELPVGHVILLGSLGPDKGFERSAEVLAGWESVVGRSDSLTWAAARLMLAAGTISGRPRQPGRPATLGELAGAATLLLVELQPWASHSEDVQHRAAELTLVLARLPVIDPDDALRSIAAEPDSG